MMKWNQLFLSVISKACVVLLITALAACTTTLQPLDITEQQAIQVAPEQQTKMSWYAVRVKIHWEKEQEPNWYFGTLIAGEVISPLLKEYQQSIICWRVHRRAVRDKTGHVFSFIFYSSPADAGKIYQLFQNSKLLTTLLEKKYLDKVSYDPLQIKSPATIADTSDPAWPDEMRNSWPFFMMGASQMWLAQVRSYKQQISDDAELKLRYQGIQASITELWRDQGKHALIHHLNGLYAYQPVLVRF